MTTTPDDLVQELIGSDDELPDLVHATPADVALAKANDLGLAALLVTFTEAEARAAGAFTEDALTAAEALASARDEEA